MLRYKTKTRPGLVALYDIRPGYGAGPFLQARSPHGAHDNRTNSQKVLKFKASMNSKLSTITNSV